MRAAKELNAEVRADIAEFDENASSDPDAAILAAATAAAAKAATVASAAAAAAAAAAGGEGGETAQMDAAGLQEADAADATTTSGMSDATRRLCTQFSSIEAEVIKYYLFCFLRFLFKYKC